MQKRFLILTAALTVCVSAQAGLYSYSSGTLNLAIPDADPNGVMSRLTVSDIEAGAWVTAVSVTLNVSGGYNGDLRAYLSYNGTLVPLLNRVGTTATDPFGYPDRGFGPDSLNNPFILSDTGSYDVHNYGDHSPQFNGSGQLTGTWRPDGSSFVSFHDMNPNGAWTLFFADLSGGEQSTLVGWSLNVTAVPEPVTMALVVFVALAGGIKLVLWRRRSARTSPAI